ncbi:MAG: hypothetical protein ACR2P0_15465 [Acidimicrobiales bacterium]
MTAAARYRFGAIRGQGEVGWSWDDIRLVVDDAFVPAPVHREGRNEPFRFAARVPTSVFDGASHVLSLAIGGEPVTEHVAVTATELMADRFDSHLVVAGGLRFKGWIQDASDPEGNVSLIASLAGTEIGAFETEEGRSAVHERLGGNPNCGFTFEVPPHLVTVDEQELMIRTSCGQSLRGTPRSVNRRSAIAGSMLTIERALERVRARCDLVERPTEL